MRHCQMVAGPHLRRLDSAGEIAESVWSASKLMNLRQQAATSDVKSSRRETCALTGQER